MIETVKLSKIYFTQDSLKYDNNIKLMSMFEKLKEGKETIDEITKRTPLNVYKIQKCYTRDVYYSCNDRRLCVFKDYEQYFKKIFQTNLNKNFGLSITVKINPIQQHQQQQFSSEEEAGVPFIARSSIFV